MCIYCRDSSIDEIEKEKLKMQREYRETRIQRIQEARRPSKLLLGFRQMVGEVDKDAKRPSDAIREASTSSGSIEKDHQDIGRQNTNQNEYVVQYSAGAAMNILSNNAVTDSTGGVGKHTGDYISIAKDHKQNGFMYERTLDDYDSSDTESVVSSCSSVDSDDLDYNYQYDTCTYSRNYQDACRSSDDEGDYDDNGGIDELEFGRNINNSCINELVMSDIYSDTDTDTDNTDDDQTATREPEEIIVHRT